jgi:hypothetical protein
MASSSDDKGKRPLEEDHQDPKLKEGQVAGGSRARDPTFVGSMNAGRAFSHNMQGPTLPVLDLNFFPVIEEGLLVTDELCAQYRVLKMEIEILQEENLRLRRMLELFLAPIIIHHWYRHPLGLFQAWGRAAVSHHYLLLIYFSSRVIS